MPASAITEGRRDPVQEASAISFVEPTEAALAEAELAEAEAALARAEALEVAEVIDSEVIDQAANADDEALLDMIAMEMGAPDPIDDDEILAAIPEPVHVTPVPPNDVVPQARKPVAAAITPPVEMPPQPVLEAAPTPVAAPTPLAAPAPSALRASAASAPSAAHAPAMEVSLGSSIIASGMLSKPAKPANDPLAPIRRMSQVEKIAFFS